MIGCAFRAATLKTPARSKVLVPLLLWCCPSECEAELPLFSSTGTATTIGRRASRTTPETRTTRSKVTVPLLVVLLLSIGAPGGASSLREDELPLFSSTQTVTTVGRFRCSPASAALLGLPSGIPYLSCCSSGVDSTRLGAPAGVKQERHAAAVTASPITPFFDLDLFSVVSCLLLLPSGVAAVVVVEEDSAGAPTGALVSKVLLPAHTAVAPYRKCQWYCFRALDACVHHRQLHRRADGDVAVEDAAILAAAAGGILLLSHGCCYTYCLSSARMFCHWRYTSSMSRH
ncbi:uncharacterized protein LOC124698928 [Lolium rigidum]|uniref:uncharacterized protein LOC124698928 n=1 Tax=Lolium rigidum TaxID=89674 RepID=UPI001F5DAA86|nr:uncharacterized protein LOC124698928 [Lolium rigidum]